MSDIYQQCNRCGAGWPGDGRIHECPVPTDPPDFAPVDYPPVADGGAAPLQQETRAVNRETHLSRLTTALENWGRHFDRCAIRRATTEALVLCDCGLAREIDYARSLQPAQDAEAVEAEGDSIVALVRTMLAHCTDDEPLCNTAGDAYFQRDTSGHMSRRLLTVGMVRKLAAEAPSDV